MESISLGFLTQDSFLLATPEFHLIDKYGISNNALHETCISTVVFTVVMKTCGNKKGTLLQKPRVTLNSSLSSTMQTPRISQGREINIQCTIQKRHLPCFSTPGFTYDTWFYVDRYMPTSSVQLCISICQVKYNLKHILNNSSRQRSDKQMSVTR